MQSNITRCSIVCLLFALTAPVHALQSKQNGKQELQLHLAIEAYFVLPGDLEPNTEQQQQLSHLRQIYGPRMQLMAPTVMQALNIRDVSQQANKILRGARRAGAKPRRLGKQGTRKKIKRAKPQVRAVLKQFEALEKEIDQHIEGMLTPEQKKALAAQNKANRKKDSNKSQDADT